MNSHEPVDLPSCRRRPGRGHGGDCCTSPSGSDDGKAADRLDPLVGRNVRKDSSADMLLKQALQEVDKKTLLDRLTPEFFNLTQVFEQADCNIKPSVAVRHLARRWRVVGGRR